MEHNQPSRRRPYSLRAAEINKRFRSGHYIVRSLKAKANLKRTFPEKIADFMTKIFGNIVFLLLNVLWFIFWISLNSVILPALHIPPFDPFPYGLLTMVVSLEAILLAIFVLVSQNRAAVVADLREELDLQVNIITEQEITKLLHIVTDIAQAQGIDVSEDPVLKEMLEPINVKTLERALEREFTGDLPK